MFLFHETLTVLSEKQLAQLSDTIYNKCSIKNSAKLVR